MFFQVNHSRELDIFSGLRPKYEHDLFLTLCCCSNPRYAATNALCVIVLGNTICSSWSVCMVITKGLRYGCLCITEFCQSFVKIPAKYFYAPFLHILAQTIFMVCR
jgi:hypothetical protein